MYLSTSSLSHSSPFTQFPSYAVPLSHSSPFTQFPFHDVSMSLPRSASQWEWNWVKSSHPAQFHAVPLSCSASRALQEKICPLFLEKLPSFCPPFILKTLPSFLFWKFGQYGLRWSTLVLPCFKSFVLRVSRKNRWPPSRCPKAYTLLFQSRGKKLT